jgi:ankyrin repeat protein
MQDRFRPLLADMSETFGFDIREATLGHAIVFNSIHWMRLISVPRFWSRRDCLGIPLLHFILEQLNDGYPGVPKPGSEGWAQLLNGIATGKANDMADFWEREAVHIAAQQNLPDVLGALLDAGMDPNAATGADSTPLHYGVAMGHAEVCAVLIRHTDTDLNCKDAFDRTPLDYAARMGYENVVRLLLADQRVDVNSRTVRGNTPLMSGLRWSNNRSIYKPFLEISGVHFNTTNDLDERLLYIAVLSKNKEAVQDLVSRCVVSINARDSKGLTALNWAVLSHDLEDTSIIRILLEVPGIVASIADDRGRTPLHNAAAQNHGDACRLLAIRIDGGLFATDEDGDTPIGLAHRCGNTATAEFITTFMTRVRQVTG